MLKWQAIKSVTSTCLDIILTTTNDQFQHMNMNSRINHSYRITAGHFWHSLSAESQVKFIPKIRKNMYTLLSIHTTASNQCNAKWTSNQYQDTLVLQAILASLMNSNACNHNIFLNQDLSDLQNLLKFAFRNLQKPTPFWLGKPQLDSYLQSTSCNPELRMYIKTKSCSLHYHMQRMLYLTTTVLQLS